MTEIQLTNVQVANYIIDELHKDKPFWLELDSGQTGSLYNIAKESSHLEFDVVEWTKSITEGRVKAGTGILIRIEEVFADRFYHMLSSYIDNNWHKQNLPESVVQSLKEVS